MTRTLEAVFDGEVFRPDSTIDLPANHRYTLTIEPVDPADKPAESTAWDVLESLAGSVAGPEDWAAEHDHYLYGVPKRGGRSE